jgi:hypothetical protein
MNTLVYLEQFEADRLGTGGEREAAESTNGVVAARVKRVTLDQPPDCQPEAAPQAVGLERPDRVLGAGGAEAADGWSEPGEALVEVDQAHQQPRHDTEPFPSTGPVLWAGAGAVSGEPVAVSVHMPAR